MKTRCDLVEFYASRIWSSVLDGVGRDGAPPIMPAIRIHLNDMLRASDEIQHRAGSDLIQQLQPRIVKRKR